MPSDGVSNVRIKQPVHDPFHSHEAGTLDEDRGPGGCDGPSRSDRLIN